MDEGDPPATSAAPRCLVDEAIPSESAGGESRVEVHDSVADVVNPRPPLGEESGDGSIGAVWREQLNLGLAERQTHDGRAVGGLGRVRLETEHVTIKGERLADVRHGDPDMSDAGEIRQAALQTNERSRLTLGE
jgi:hypothetical protein